MFAYAHQASEYLCGSFRTYVGVIDGCSVPEVHRLVIRRCVFSVSELHCEPYLMRKWLWRVMCIHIDAFNVSKMMVRSMPRIYWMNYSCKPAHSQMILNLGYLIIKHTGRRKEHIGNSDICVLVNTSHSSRVYAIIYSPHSEQDTANLRESVKLENEPLAEANTCLK
jgi:hypothetical protein